MKRALFQPLLLVVLFVSAAAAIFALYYFGLGEPEINKLVQAAAYDNMEEVKNIIDRGVDPNAQEKGMLGYTPLVATTFIDGTNAFFYLLSKGVNVDARDRDGQTALMTAIMAFGDANIVKIKALINAGADVNARDSHGNSVLHYAAMASIGRPTVSTTNLTVLLKERGARE